jgi:hypothetical protein
MTDGTVTWETLKTLAAEAGIGEGFEAFEKELKGRFVTALLAATGTQDRYLQDGIFRTRANAIVEVIVQELTQQKAPRITTNMDELQKIFQEEVGKSRQ